MSEIPLDTILNQQVSLLESNMGTDKEKEQGWDLISVNNFRIDGWRIDTT
jgi:hypothetical protein